MARGGRRHHVGPYAEGVGAPHLRCAMVFHSAGFSASNAFGRMTYEFRLLDRGGVEAHRFEVDCATDGAALAEAEFHVATNTVEVWAGERLVGRLPVRGPAPNEGAAETSGETQAVSHRRRRFVSRA
ncbi:MAG TPA: hypothetical protein VFW13_02285, partial [Phenylobacterium sp.]|nr:hypothetical protein [Phenylobacterium sp.]